MKSKDKGYKWLQGTTTRQLQATQLLVQGKTDHEMADAVGVHRVTVTNWHNLAPYFQAQPNRRRQDVWGCSTERLRAMLRDALDLLERELQVGNPQVAVQMLKLAGLMGLEQPAGETDAQAIVDNLAMKNDGSGLLERVILENQGVGD